MKYKVIISDKASAMLESHFLFLARVSPSAADKLVDKILDEIESLHENPERFPIYQSENITNCTYHKMLSAKRYLVIYEISGDTVNVDYIVDCRSDYQWLIR